MSEFDTDHRIDPTLFGTHAPRLKELQQRWNMALPEVAAHFGLPEHEATPYDLQEQSFRAWMHEREKAPDSPIVIGIAGPGACGKGTISSHLETALEFPKVINTTTRPPRHNEVNGRDYHFLAPEEFEYQRSTGAFLTTTNRPNRGTYAISKSEIEEKLANCGTGCIIEENPATLLSALDTARISIEKEPLTTLLYLLPPDPMVETLAMRLHQRSSDTPAERELTENDIESTLGDRQIDEFLSLSQATQYPNVNVVFFVNDDIQRTYEKIKVLFGSF